MKNGPMNPFSFEIEPDRTRADVEGMAFLNKTISWLQTRIMEGHLTGLLVVAVCENDMDAVPVLAGIFTRESLELADEALGEMSEMVKTMIQAGKEELEASDAPVPEGD
jgi:hypothetical protein